MNIIKTYDEAVNQKQVALNIILASYNKRLTARNRSILQSYLIEFHYDPDWKPHNHEKQEEYLKFIDIKKYLD